MFLHMVQVRSQAGVKGSGLKWDTLALLNVCKVKTLTLKDEGITSQTLKAAGEQEEIM